MPLYIIVIGILINLINDFIPVKVNEVLNLSKKNQFVFIITRCCIIYNNMLRGKSKTKLRIFDKYDNVMTIIVRVMGIMIYITFSLAGLFMFNLNNILIWPYFWGAFTYVFLLIISGIIRSILVKYYLHNRHYK
jgi:hypothetical protein